MAREIRKAWQAGRAAWPGLALSEADFAEHVAGVETAAAAAGEPAWTDLFLAAACARDVSGAVEAFETAFRDEIDAARRRRRDLPLERDELLQLVRERLFVAPPGESPRIAAYSGRGELRAWVRVVLARLVSNLARTPSPEVPVDHRAMTYLLGRGEDPELAHMKARYRAEFEVAFVAALAALTPRERSLLRLAFVEDLSVDAIGAVYRVHRATAARWVAAAHASLAAKVRAALKERLDVTTGECESILRLIQSQIDLTLKRYLPA